MIRCRVDITSHYGSFFFFFNIVFKKAYCIVEPGYYYIFFSEIHLSKIFGVTVLALQMLSKNLNLAWDASLAEDASTLILWGCDSVLHSGFCLLDLSGLGFNCTYAFITN